MNQYSAARTEAQLPWGKALISLFVLCCQGAQATTKSPVEVFEEQVKFDVQNYYGEFNYPIDKIEIAAKLPTRLTKKGCNDMAIKRQPAHRAPIKKVRYNISCSSGDEVYRGHASVGVWMPIIVSQRQIEVGEHLTETMLARVSSDISELRGGFTLNKNQVLSYRVKRKIDQHQAINLSYLQAPKLVSRGNLVTLQAHGNGFVASVKVEALDDGILGEVIKVRNLSSNKIIQARVIGKNLLKSEK